MDYTELFNQIRNSGLNPLGCAMASTGALFRQSTEIQNQVKAALIADNFCYHYENNAFYRETCDRLGVTPNEVATYEDLVKIPLVPVRRFKDTDSHKLLTTSLDKIEFEMRSTGTSGIPSVSRRDTPTVTDAILSIYSMYREFFAMSKGAILYLMPSTEEIPEMGMIKALNMFSGLADATRCVVKRVSFKPDQAIDILRKWEDSHTRYIVGPPFLVYKLVSYLKENEIRMKLDKQTRIINLGGWKRFTGMEIPRAEYNRLCAEYLGIKENQIRDMYGLVEANNLAIECEHGSKHVAPWVHYSVRDQQDLSKEVPDGRRGVLAILDPTSTSYPTFIMTEDLVYLKQDSECACGRNGQQLVYLTRVANAELGCCAINLERQMSEQEARDACVLV